MNSSQTKSIRFAFLPVIFSCVTGIFALLHTAVASADPVAPIITVEPRVTVHDVQPFGINVGKINPFGASQIMKNLIPNPGFEGGEFAMLFLVDRDPTTDTVQADNWYFEWDRDYLMANGQSPDMWTGGEYEVIHGAALSRTGRVLSFTHAPDAAGDLHYTWQLDGSDPAPQYLDVVRVSQTFTDVVSGCCWPASQMADPTEMRPGSSGSQSLKMLAPVDPLWLSYRLYLDTYGRDSDRSAGKLLIVDGEYTLAFWARAERAGDTMRIKFQREGEAIFYEETITPTMEWSLITRTFTVASGTDTADGYSVNNPSTGLRFEIDLKANSGAIWLDDMLLQSNAHTNPTVFSDAFVDSLRDLHPGILRNWGNQLGSTLDNQLADAFGRKTTGWSPLDDRATKWHYGLHEFLELAVEVGAQPWYVVPPTFTDEEMKNLAAYLTYPEESGHPYALKRVELGQIDPWIHIFDKMHIEFGNEMWGSAFPGDPFFGATVRGGDRLGAISQRRLKAFRDAKVNSADFNLIVGGQVGYVPQNNLIETWGNGHDSLALAPYFGTLNTWENDREIFQPLFATPHYNTTLGNVSQIIDVLNSHENGTQLSIYENNFHTTSGDSPLDIRNDFVTAAAGGLALPLHSLTYLRDYSARYQAAFNILQYSHPVWNPSVRATTPEWALYDQYELTSSGQLDGREPNLVQNTEFVRVWGLLRDLETTGRPRPTWLGLSLVNEAVHGDMLQTVQQNTPTWTQVPINGVGSEIEVPAIQSFAFRDGDHHALVLFNLHLTDTQTVTLNLPLPSAANGTISVLGAGDIHADNEELLEVEISAEDIIVAEQMSLTLPAHSLSVLSWESNVIPTAVALYTARSQNESHTIITMLIVIIVSTLLIVGLYKHNRGLLERK